MTTNQRNSEPNRPSLFWPWCISLSSFILLLALAGWQVMRMVEKEALITHVTSRMAQGPVTLGQALGSLSGHALEYTPLQVQGVWQHAKTFFVGPRSFNGGSGYHILTPLRLENGQAVLVNRGWIPEKKKAGWLAEQPKESESGMLRGIIRLPRKVGWFVPENSPEKNHWFWEDVKAMEQHYGAELIPVVVYSTTVTGARFPIPMSATPRFRNDHWHYALTWFALAIAVGGIFLLWLRKHTRQCPA